MKPDFYPLSKKMWFCTFKFAWNLASKPTNRRDKVSAKSRRHAINLTGKAEHVPKRAWMDQQNHHITYYTLNHPNFLQINTNVRVWSINNNPNSPLAGFWDSVRIDRISPISEGSEPNLVFQNSNILKNLIEKRPKLIEIRPIRLGPNFSRNWIPKPW